MVVANSQGGLGIMVIEIEAQNYFGGCSLFSETRQVHPVNDLVHRSTFYWTFSRRGFNPFVTSVS